MRKTVPMIAIFEAIGLLLAGFAFAQIDEAAAKKPKSPVGILRLSPASTINFGKVRSARSGFFVLSSTGTATVTGNVGTPSAPFSIVAGGGPFSLDPGNSLTVSITFAPTAKGNFRSSVVITSNAKQGNKFTVHLIGSARAAVTTSAATPTATATPTPVAGDALILGGLVNNAASGSAEIYSAELGQFFAVGNMNCPRYSAKAVSLPAGKAFVTTDGGSGVAYDTVELFDSSTGQFTLGPKLPDHRQGYSETALSDGTVLIAGGMVFGGCIDSSVCGGACSEPPSPTLSGDAELFDPSSGNFTKTGALNIARSQHLAALLSDGRVLVVGGVVASGGYTTAAEIYDPSAGTFAETADLPDPVLWEHAVTLNNGKVLLVGGRDSAGASISHAELFDPKAGTFSATGNPVTPREATTAILLANGQVLLAGGASCSNSSSCDSLASAELYDPNSGSFSATGNLTMNRRGAQANLLGNGKVLVSGGTTCSGGANCPTSTDPAECDLYDPATGEFSSAGSMSTGREGHGAATLK